MAITSMERTKQTPRWPRFFEQLSFSLCPALPSFASFINFHSPEPFCNASSSIFHERLRPGQSLWTVCFWMFALSAAWPVVQIVLLCPPQEDSSAWFLCKASSLISHVQLKPCQSLWTVCFWIFVVHFCSWLKNHSLNEEMKMFRVVRVVSRPFGIPMGGPLEMSEPLWLQTANKTEGWPVKFSALLDKLQQHGFCALKPDKTNLFNQQEFLWNSNQGAPAQDWVGGVVGYAVAHDQDSDSHIHKQSAALGKRPESVLSRLVRRSQVHWFNFWNTWVRQAAAFTDQWRY